MVVSGNITDISLHTIRNASKLNMHVFIYLDIKHIATETKMAIMFGDENENVFYKDYCSISIRVSLKFDRSQESIWQYFIICSSKGSVPHIRQVITSTDVRMSTWISDYIQRETPGVITYPHPDQRKSILVKWSLVVYDYNCSEVSCDWTW